MHKDALNVSELFYSIQGESTYAGFPCVFIRLAGCNLRCRYCDAQYTYNDTGQQKTIPEIIHFTEKYPQALIEITGGEPLLQQEVYPLMDKLLARGRTLLLETNGSMDLSRVPEQVIKIVDIKCPDSGMGEKTHWQSLARLNPKDEVKFVISSQSDYSWAKKLIAEKTFLQNATLLFSPVTERLAATDLADWMLQDRLQVKLQLQMHKLLWPHASRGV